MTATFRYITARFPQKPSLKPPKTLKKLSKNSQKTIIKLKKQLKKSKKIYKKPVKYLIDDCLIQKKLPLVSA
jgi:hypothetical protein